MKPISIEHANAQPDGHDVVVDIELTPEDKEMIHKYHLESGDEDYDIDDISMLVWIYVDTDGNIRGYSYDEASYYPAQQGETYFSNDKLPPELEAECCRFVEEHPGYQIL